MGNYLCSGKECGDDNVIDVCDKKDIFLDNKCVLDKNSDGIIDTNDNETISITKISVGKDSDSNYWSGSCSVYKDSTKVYINNLSNIISFKLKKAVFDDWIRISVNGHIVKVAPYDGDRLEVVNNEVEYRIQINKQGKSDIA